MTDIDVFFTKLKKSIEEHSSDLKKGELFGPEYLKDKVFSQMFKKVAQTLGTKLELEVKEEVTNHMPDPKKYAFGHRQIVDYVYNKVNEDIVFLELETLDRSQLYLFCDVSEEIDENKLWYYLGTVIKHIILEDAIPRYFVWLLILPDRKVDDYSANLWDIKQWGDKKEFILHPSLRNLIFDNPYRFYDHLIKTSARLFLEARRDELDGKCLKDFQNDCELVFLTCTGKQLIMSRGKDNFTRESEMSELINWTDK